MRLREQRGPAHPARRAPGTARIDSRIAAAIALSAVTILSATTMLGPLEAVAADTRGWLGIYHEPVSELPSLSGFEGDTQSVGDARSGLRVIAVWPDSPAEGGDLRVGDIIVGVQDRTFHCPAESVRAVYQRSVAPLQMGERLQLRVLRDGVERTLRRNGVDLRRAETEEFWFRPDSMLQRLRPGDEIVARAALRRRVLDLTITLGPRPEAVWAPGKSAKEIDPEGRYRSAAYVPLIWSLVDAFDRRSDTEDLLARLERCHKTADPHRLEWVTFAHLRPWYLESLARDVTNRLGAAAGAPEILAEARRMLVPRAQNPAGERRRPDRTEAWRVSDSRSSTPSPARRYAPVRARRMEAGPLAGPAPGKSRRFRPAEREARLRPLLVQINSVLEEASTLHRRAFAALTEEERRFLEEHRFDLSDAFAADIYIHFDEDRSRFARNRRLITLAERVDYSSLLAAAESAARLADPTWAQAAAGLVRRTFADTLDGEILFDRLTPYGRILFGGTSRHWYRNTDTAFSLDLGGDDFYTGNEGGNAGWHVPVAVCVDLEGDDAYESTLPGCQGAGCLGVGALLDLAGDDRYIGIRWCQGTGYFGVGWLHDLAGNDVYRGRAFCQGTGLFGLGFVLDQAGDDRYEGDAKVQAVGLARGLGILLDRRGDDRYYAKGLYPTNYGDAGIFDAWSQGCGIGFRTVASGGLGLLVDGGGADEMEAGNFSQGGGYYYGLGMLRAFGREDDRYIGSRYNQGFCAHQAAGVFLEDGGDDFYTTRQAVAQGLAWDECVTLFVDESGDDVYQGGGGFSQGASAHNSVCLFFDRSGQDRYEYAPGQAMAGGNDYHGGTSLSLFVDEGGANDIYDAPISGNDAWRERPEHGFFLDLPGSAEDAGRGTALRPTRGLGRSSVRCAVRGIAWGTSRSPARGATGGTSQLPAEDASWRTLRRIR